MTSPNTPVDVEAANGLIERLKVAAGVRVLLTRGELANLCDQAASALSRLLAERREMLEALKKLSDGDYRIISGSPGPLFDAGWNACAASFVERLRAILSALPEGKGE